MENPDLLTHDGVLAYFGGANKPIHWSTMVRGMRNGKYPRPINIGGYRWLRSECDAAISRMIAERDARFPQCGYRSSALQRWNEEAVEMALMSGST